MDSLDNVLPKPNFVNVDDKYKCVKCEEPVSQPMQLECGHRICKSCFDNIKASNTELKCPSNDPECEETTDLSQVFLDKSLLKEMMKQSVFCKFHIYKCKFTSPWNKIKEHENICEYKEKSCPHCETSIPIEKYQEHLDRICLKVPGLCPYKCSQKLFIRAELDSHKEVCIKKPSLCKYKSFGCQFQGIAEEVAKHESDQPNEHLLLALTLMDNIKNETENSMQKFQNDLASKDITIYNLKTSIEELKEKVTSIEPQISIIHENESKIYDLNSTVNDLKQDYQEKISNIPTTSKTSNSLPDEMRQRFYKHEETIAEHDKLLTSQDLRLQCLETANFQGELVWKITDFRRRKQQAINGQVLSLYSQPFYSDHYGYKMCARVYLNGDGIGKGTHLSLFFVIMQGDFDDILTWPFCRKVTFMLLDQKTNKRHLVDSFKPDKNSSSFQKPTTSMNIASGCPLFVPHTTLENIDEMYLRNNIIFLKVIVDKEDL